MLLVRKETNVSHLQQTVHDAEITNKCISVIIEATSYHDLKSRVSHARTVTNRPIIIKGIMGTQDALMCCELGVEGIIIAGTDGGEIDVVRHTLVDINC